MREWPPKFEVQRKRIKKPGGVRLSSTTLRLIKECRLIGGAIEPGKRTPAIDDAIRVAMLRLKHSLTTKAERAGINWRAAIAPSTDSAPQSVGPFPPKYRPPIE